jgi:hypothetical protein
MKTTSPTARLLARIAAVALAALAMDAALGAVLRTLYFRLDNGKAYRITCALEEATPPLWVMGSSRAYVHYRPDILQAGLGLDVFNAGHDAAGLLYQAALLRGILARTRPRRIILDFDPDGLAAGPLGSQVLSALLPYERDHPEMRAILRRRSPVEGLKLLSRVYPFNSQIASILLARRVPWKDDRGFVALEGSWERPFGDPPSSYGRSPDPGLIGSFREVAALCRKKGVSLAVVVSPVGYHLPGETPSMAVARGICRREGIPFLDLSRDERLAGRPELFHDPAHLNADGAALFSRILVEALAPVFPPASASRAKTVVASGR